MSEQANTRVSAAERAKKQTAPRKRVTNKQTNEQADMRMAQPFGPHNGLVETTEHWNGVHNTIPLHGCANCHPHDCTQSAGPTMTLVED